MLYKIHYFRYYRLGRGHELHPKQIRFLIERRNFLVFCSRLLDFSSRYQTPVS